MSIEVITPTKDPTTSFVLKVVDQHFKSYGGFQWPNEVGAEVGDANWIADGYCGHGLHGWLNGVGDVTASDYWNMANHWLVLEVETYSIIDLHSKVKFPRATVRFIGSLQEASFYLLTKGLCPEIGVSLSGPEISVGDLSVAVGEKKASAGRSGAAVVTNFRGVAEVGDGGVALAGNEGIAVAGHFGAALAGQSGKAFATTGVAMVKDFGTATATGCRGVAICGESGSAISETHGIAIGNFGSSVAGGARSVLILPYYCDGLGKFAVAIVGENGIKPGVLYKLDDNGSFVPVFSDEVA